MVLVCLGQERHLLLFRKLASVFCALSKYPSLPSSLVSIAWLPAVNHVPSTREWYCFSSCLGSYSEMLSSISEPNEGFSFFLCTQNVLQTVEGSDCMSCLLVLWVSWVCNCNFPSLFIICFWHLLYFFPPCSSQRIPHIRFGGIVYFQWTVNMQMKHKWYQGTDLLHYGNLFKATNG